MKQKAIGLATGGLAFIAPLASFAAAPTSFSTTTAVSILDTGYDLVVSMITAVFPILLPVIATLGFVFLVWRYIVSKARL